MLAFVYLIPNLEGNRLTNDGELKEGEKDSSAFQPGKKMLKGEVLLMRVSF